MKHLVMRFEFSGMGKAYEFQNAVLKCEIPASAVFENGKWIVKTDSRCMLHAHKLVKFIYAKAAAA